MGLAASTYDRWLAARNRLLASPRFQAFAAAFPPFRPTARRRSRQLFDLLAGFSYSQVLYTIVRLGLVEMLEGHPLPVAGLAARTGWRIEAMERLLRAACALGLLERTAGGLVTLGIHGAALAGNPWIARFVTHHHLLYADLADPLALLSGEARETGLRRFWGYSGHQEAGAVDAPNAAAYTALMAASQQAVAREILAAYDFSRHRHVIDIGGSDGTFLSALAARAPGLGLTLFDLPAVAAIAAERLAGQPRITVRGGSFLTDPLPRGPDAATLIRIVHDHDDPAILTLFRAVRAMLPDNGVLLVAEPLSGQPATAPVTDAYFGLYFAAMGQGRTRSPAEIAGLARAAGFAGAAEVKTRNPLLTGLLKITVS